MKTESFNDELSTSTIQFLDIFNNIAFTGRANKDRKVTVAVGTRSRIFKNLESPEKGNITLPMIIINRTGIARDTTRVNDVNENIKALTGSFDPNDIAGNPVDLSFEVTILTKKINDIDRIISNFLVYMNPDIYVRIPHPKIPTEKINLQVIWDGTVSEEFPKELTPDQHDTKVATLNFTLKSWLFGGTQSSISSGKLIETVNFTLTESISGDPENIVGGFYAVPTEIDLCDYFDQVADGTITDPDVDQFVVSGTVD